MLYPPLNFLNPFPPSIILPSHLVAGDTWVFTLPQGPYTGGGYSASMTFGAGSVSFTAEALIDNSNNFVFTFLASQTGIAPGPYRYSISVLDSAGNRTTIQTGAVPVIADPASQQWTQGESWLHQAIRELEQKILWLIGQKVEMVSFGGKQYYLPDAEKLFKLRNEMLARAAAEDAAMLGNANANIILPLFVNR